MERNNKLAIDNARIIFKNFTGKDDKFGREGDRSFSIVIEDDALAEQLANDGWNVKPLTPRDPDEKVNHFIKVKISFRVRPPKIWLADESQTHSAGRGYHRHASVRPHRECRRGRQPLALGGQRQDRYRGLHRNAVRKNRRRPVCRQVLPTTRSSDEVPF